MKINALAATVAVASGLLAGGCNSAGRMTAQETADFRGGPHQPMSAAKKRAMADFQDQFRKLHPGAGGSPNGPPANLPAGGATSGRR